MIHVPVSVLTLYTMYDSFYIQFFSVYCPPLFICTNGGAWLPLSSQPLQILCIQRLCFSIRQHHSSYWSVIFIVFHSRRNLLFINTSNCPLNFFNPFFILAIMLSELGHLANESNQLLEWSLHSIWRNLSFSCVSAFSNSLFVTHCLLFLLDKRYAVWH